MDVNKLTLMFLFVATVISCSTNSSKETKPKLVLAKEGVEYAYPHFSKDGAKILFQSNESGNWQICIVNLKGSNIKELTTDTFNCYFPDWSPDNKLICFVSDKTGYEEIYIMNADGTNKKQLTNNKARNIHPYFSPNGEKIFFSSTLNGSNSLDVYQMDIDGTDIKQITTTLDNETCARMSPDNKYLTYLKNNNKGLDDLFLLSVSDSMEVNLTDTKTLDGWPSWSPDGKHIIFSAVKNDQYRLFTYNLENKKINQLTNPPWPNNDCRANFSRNGKMIVFNRQLDNKDSRSNAIYILHLE